MLVLIALLLFALSGFLVYSALTTKPPKGVEEETVGDGDKTVDAVAGATTTTTT